MKRKRILFSILFITVNFSISTKVHSQGQVIQSDSLYSQILQEQRQLHIVLPRNYDPTSTDKYEILYCLDDINDFLTTEWSMLQWEGFIPKNMIMVGITNPNIGGVDMRDRDFTPTKASAISGGAANFLSFFKTELIPFINKKYKGASEGNVLYGGSLGGLFVMYTFLEDPTLFTSYIAIDPSLWWDNFLLNNVASTKFDSWALKILHSTLFLAGREGNDYRYMGVAGMDSVLKIKAPAGLNWKATAYINETHYSANFKGFWEGLKFSYGGFYASSGGYSTSRKIAIKPKRGLVLKDVPFKLICYNLMAGTYIHYTTDGSDPTISSHVLEGDETPIILTKDSKILVKSMGVRSEYNRMDSSYFEIGSVFKSISKPKNAYPGGLRYTYYEGDWSSLQSVKDLKPNQHGLAGEDFDVNKFDGNKNFACILNGYLKIHKPGYYIIEMGEGNDYSKVYLNNQQVLGEYFKAEEGESYLIPLEAGYFPFRIEYFHKKDGDQLAPIYLKPEGEEDFPIPLDMLYSN